MKLKKSAKKSDTPYQIHQSYATDKQRRARKPLHNSRLPKFITNRKAFQNFMRLSKKRRVMLAAWAGASFLIVLALFTTVFFANTLGSKESIMNRGKTGLTLEDQNGQTIARFFDAREATYVPLDQIAPVAQKAVISSENKNFYTEPGFSVTGIGFAVWQNIKPGGSNGGGSTLTQQLVATSLLSKKRSLIRKYQELVLSVEIERRYTKDEILEMYLNSVYFGEGAFGIENASQVYFGKPAKDLTTAEASMLIGLLPAPSAYSPVSGDPAKAKIRQNYVLGRMVDDGIITEADKEAALATELAYAPPRAEETVKAPHFSLMVKDELIKKYGEEKIARSGYVVKTTLNLDWQNKAEAAVTAQVNRLAGSNVTNGSVVITDPKTGEIRALVGSKDWDNEAFGKYNIATATRQPGSSFKPIVYATGIENKDFSAATLFDDKATDFGGGYSPKNYDLRYRGDVTMRRALANSLNIPAVEALQKAGIDPTIQTAEDMGLTTLDEDGNYGLSMALGTAPAKLTEMTNAYATFANAGKYNDVTTISTITDKNNKVIFTAKPKSKQAISSQTSYIISSVLSDNTARSEVFGSSLSLSGGRAAAVKTGTTEDYRDAWTIGYTPSLAIGVWIGNNDNSQMSRVAGSSGSGPIWKSLMQQILAGSPNETFTQPSGLTVRTICRGDGALSDTSGGNTMTEYFIPGTLPTTKCNVARQVETTTPAPSSTNTPTEEQKPDQTTGSGSGSGDGNQTTTPTVPVTPTTP